MPHHRALASAAVPFALLLAGAAPATAASIRLSAGAYPTTESSGSVPVTIVSSGANPVTVQYTTEPGTAGDADFRPTAGSVDLPADPSGPVAATVTVPIKFDTTEEPTEDFTFRITGVSAGDTLLEPSAATISIADRSRPQSLAFTTSTPTASEAMATAVIGVVRTNGTAGTVTVDYSTVDGGSGAANVNYEPVRGTLTFPPGDAFQPIVLPLMQNTLVQGPTTEAIALRNPSAGAEIVSPGDAMLTIVDDDQPAHVRFAVSASTVPETAGSALITVLRLGAPGGEAAVDWATSGPDAATPARKGTLKFASGQVAASFVVPVKWDRKATGDRSVKLSLANASGPVVLDEPTSATLTIHDIDQPPPGAPKMSVRVAGRQRATGNPGIVLGVKPNTTMRVQGSGSLRIGKRTIRLRKLDRRIGATGRTKLVVPYARGAWKVIGHALRKGGSVSASVRVVGTDGFGRKVTVRRRVHIVG